jgi:hypothetical protein
VYFLGSQLRNVSNAHYGRGERRTRRVERFLDGACYARRCAQNLELVAVVGDKRDVLSGLIHDCDLVVNVEESDL